jgi:DNA-binding transcriptional ArsR family regulator
MKALSDPNRVKMMKMLQARPLCVCEIKAALGIAQSTASKHLKILEDAEENEEIERIEKRMEHLRRILAEKGE